MAPGLDAIAVYVIPGGASGWTTDSFLSGLNRIATDNTARQVSISLMTDELTLDHSYLNSEFYIFAQMAAQGQSVFVSSGDRGPYGYTGKYFTTGDPASQPFVTSVGGSTVYGDTFGRYSDETVWNTGTASSSGGGVSSVWPIPSWQQGLPTAASSILRNVPDVALNAGGTNYSIYYWGNWTGMAGTSASTPLWAAFNALVNEKRISNGSPVLGFANPSLYQIAAGLAYQDNFHDITSGDNGYYYATAGYDNVTGLGSFNGFSLWSTLTTPPPVPTGLSATILSGSGSQRPISVSWNPVAGPATYSIFRGTTSGGEGGVPISSGITGTSFTDTGSYNGTYYYKVSAQNVGGTSAISSNEASASLIDTTAPTGAVNINGGATISLYTTVAIYPSATDNPDGSGVGYLQYSTDNVNWSSWYPYMTSFMYSFPGTGWRCIFVRFKDFAGNISQSYGAAIYIL